MADAPKILGTDSLRSAYPKLNSAIDNSNEALTKAGSADGKADNAITTANTAKSTAENVQTQFNQVVIDGDSSVEAAQARVDADGNAFTTLKERLDDRDAQLAQKTNDLEGRGINVKSFGAVGDGITNDHTSFISATEKANLLDVPLIIPNGEFFIDGETIEITTDVVCYGLITTPNDNGKKLFLIKRKNQPQTVSSSMLSGLIKGSSNIGLTGYANYDLLLQSSEVLINRNGYGNPYYKNDMVSVINNSGKITPQLDCTYDSVESLTVTAFRKEKPLTINGLSIETVGGGVDKEVIDCERSDVIFNNFKLNKQDSSSSIKAGINIFNSVNIVFNLPTINGADTTGYGYGISLSKSSLCSIYDGFITNCRHAISGRHMNDIKIVGGTYEGNIDSHWGNNLLIDKATLHSSVRYAGTNIMIKNVKVVDVPALLEIRNDTPELDGVVIIENIEFTRKDGETFTIVGHSTLDLTAYDFGRVIKNPNKVSIKNVRVDAPTDFVVYGVRVGRVRDYNQTYWDNIEVNNIETVNKSKIISIEIVKNSNFYIIKNPSIKISNIDFEGNVSSNLAGLTVRRDDTDETHGYVITVENCNKLYPIIDTASAINVKFKDVSLHYRLGRVNSSANIGDWIFDKCAFKDINFYHEGNYDFNNCVFEGTISAYPNNLNTRTMSNINPLVKTGCTGYPTINKIDGSKYITA